jgi:Ca-activated chloride channel family protein
VPVGKTINLPGVDPLKYQQPSLLTDAAWGPELLTVKLRYKQPEDEVSQSLEVPVRDEENTIESASEDFRFAAAVVEFGLLLRESLYRGTSSWAGVHKLASLASHYDPHGHRAEFLHLAKMAEKLSVHQERVSR